MARLCNLLCLILAGILVVKAMADNSEISPSSEQGGVAVAEQPASSPAESSSSSDELREAEEGTEIRRMGKHHSSDKSVAGGGVIVGGLVTAIFAAVFCYIRVTRRRDGDHGGN